MKDAIFGLNLDDASETLIKACLCNASAAVDTAVSMIKIETPRSEPEQIIFTPTSRINILLILIFSCQGSFRRDTPYDLLS